MDKHNKQYKSDNEFTYRFNVFQDNLKHYEELNRNSTGAVFGWTQFSDLTSEEFRELYLMNNLEPYPEEHPMLEWEPIKAPATFDWRSQGRVTPVKNQGQCGSCWAFSATENIESVYHITGKHGIPTLSPQQMVDCDKDCYGCGGGWPFRAMAYVARQGGQDTEASYPYTARNGQCRFNAGGVGAKISGYKAVPRDEHQIQEALASTAPFSICVDANNWSGYRSGVMRSTQCGRSIDHCVQLVGYNAQANPPYWMVRNSWGTGWGQSGYIWLEMYKDTCAMAESVTNAAL
jgi:C1A family cysteine protease